MSSEERAEIIRTAKELEPDLPEPSGPGKFEGSGDALLAVAIYALFSYGGGDEQTGSVDEFGWFGRLGRFIIHESGDGFVGLEVFECENEAERAMDEQRNLETESEEQS